MRRVGCFLVIPLLFIAIGGAFLFFSISRLSSQTTATGVIVDISQSRDSDGDTSYRPIIEFVAEDGRTYAFTGRIGSSSRPTVGNSIEVLYDPADPQGATEKTFSNLWLFPLAFGGFGLVFLVTMVIGRNRGWGGGRQSTMSDEDKADLLDEVLEHGVRRSPDSPGPISPQVGDPVGGTTAEFRRAEVSMADDGSMRYRIVAKDDAGNEYYSELLDEDPTVQLMAQGNEVELVKRDGGWVVDYDHREHE